MGMAQGWSNIKQSMKGGKLASIDHKDDIIIVVITYASLSVMSKKPTCNIQSILTYKCWCQTVLRQQMMLFETMMMVRRL